MRAVDLSSLRPGRRPGAAATGRRTPRTRREALLAVLMVVALGTLGPAPSVRTPDGPTEALAAPPPTAPRGGSRPAPGATPRRSRAVAARPKRATPAPSQDTERSDPAPPPVARGGREASVRGEVVELSGWLRDGLRGESHRAEALQTVQSGGALAIVEDETGTLYLLAGETPASDPNTAVHDLLSEHVVVAGMLYQRAGCRVLVPASVTRLAP